MWQSVRSKINLNLGDDVEISVNQSTLVLLMSAFSTSSNSASKVYDDDLESSSIDDASSPPPFRLDESMKVSKAKKKSSSNGKIPDKLRVEATLKALVVRLYEPQRRRWFAVARLGQSSLYLTQNVKTRALGT